ncbi:MAG: glycosyltransferase family 39 protein [Verrucomicrobia bacterium]|nr:glycosyltransferase family 39 protein [Verrucomicrobiota bacterium]
MNARTPAYPEPAGLGWLRVLRFTGIDFRALGRRLLGPKMSALLIALIALATFANSLGNGFMLDDYWLLDWSERHGWSDVMKPYRFGGAEDYSRMWFSAGRIAGQAGDGYFRPLVSVVYKGTSALFGLNPVAYHASCVLLHMATAVALWWVARRLFASSEAAFIAGLAFAVLPAHAEAVQWIGANAYLLVAPVYLAALGCFLRARDAAPGGERVWLLGGVAAFLVAVLGHELAITLPAVLLAVEWLRHEPGERWDFRGLLRRNAAFWALAGGYVWWRIGLLATLQAEKAGGGYLHDLSKPLDFLLGALFQTAYGFSHLLVPLPFAPIDAGTLRPLTGVLWLALGSAVVLGLTLLAFWKLGGRDRRTLLAAVLLLAPFAPALLVAPTERQLYLPSAGFCLLLALAYERRALAGRPPRQLAAVLAIGACLLTAGLNAMWSYPTGVARSQLTEMQRQLPQPERGSSIYLLNVWPPALGMELMPGLLYRDLSLDVQVLAIHPKLLTLNARDDRWLHRFFASVIPGAAGEAPVETRWEDENTLFVRISGARYMTSLIEEIYTPAPEILRSGARVKMPRFEIEVVSANEDGVEALRFHFQPGPRVVFDLRDGGVQRLAGPQG